MQNGRKQKIKEMMFECKSEYETLLKNYSISVKKLEEIMTKSLEKEITPNEIEAYDNPQK